MVIMVSSTANPVKKNVMIISRTLGSDRTLSVEKCCNNHKGPISIARPRAMVMQVDIFSINESLL